MHFFRVAKCWIGFFVIASLCMGAEFPEIRTGSSDVFPSPEDSAVATTNPPAFVWLPVKEAQTYRVSVFSSASGDLVEQFQVRKYPVLAPEHTFQPGQYKWTVQAYDENGQLMATRRPYFFTIPNDAQEFPFPDMDRLITTIPSFHPRFIFSKDSLESLRASLQNERHEAWLAVKKIADDCIDLPAPKPPWYDGIEDYTTRRLEYKRYYHYLRKFIDEGLQALSLAWLMTGEKKYADAAKRILLKVVAWDAEGITSCNEIGFDEPGLSLSRCVHRAYDWLYDALNEQERELVRQGAIERARDTFRRVGINRPFLLRPGSSHDGRLIGYLCEQALVLQGEAPEEEVRQWLDFSLTAFWTVFPHWGGRDGGWAEGIRYGAGYNIRATNWIEGCLSVLNLNLWQKPFFRQVRRFFFYCARPNDEFWPFGDGAERGPRNRPSYGKIAKTLMTHYAQRFRDPACQWWAEQVPKAKEQTANPVVSLILGQKVKAQIPSHIKNAAVFRGVGWAALHSDISDINGDVFFLFKSSPFGSVSHSHADQNAFYVSLGGRALAIPSGYYGPVYGMPHHAQWTRSSKANNTILVNGQGQKIRDPQAAGFIKDFYHGEKITYVCGSAARAYPGLLHKFDRHVLFVRPGLFLILDDLQAVQASTFQWMLHSLEEMKLNEKEQTVEINHLGARMSVQLTSSAEQPFAFSQTDQFDPPYNTGVDPKYWTDVPNQWHFTAATPSGKKSLRIAAFISVGESDDVPETQIIREDGWVGARVVLPDGSAQVWARLDANAPLPERLMKIVSAKEIARQPVVGFWQDKSGKIGELFPAK